MLYAITAILKAEAEARISEFQAEFNEHLAQPFRRLRLAGTLRGEDGGLKGYLALVEADDLAGAQRYLQESPIFKANLYEQTDVSEYRIQLGRLAGD